MRIITTWMYYDDAQIRSGERSRRFRGREEKVDPGIGIAWCPGDTTNLMSFSNLKALHELPVGREGFDEQTLRACIDAFLADEDEDRFAFVADRSIKNPDAVDDVLRQQFVIERSPPELLGLTKAITKTNFPVFIGTYMGWHVVPDHSILLFVSVPGGIIVVSSAVGLAHALASGLSTSVKRLFRER